MDKAEENFEFIDRARLKHDLGESRSCFKQHIYAMYRASPAYGGDVYDTSNYLQKPSNGEDHKDAEWRFFPRERPSEKEFFAMSLENIKEESSKLIIFLIILYFFLLVALDSKDFIFPNTSFTFNFIVLVLFTVALVVFVQYKWGYSFWVFLEDKFNIFGVLRASPAPLAFDDGYTADFFLAVKQSNQELEKQKYNLEAPDKLFGLTLPCWQVYTTSPHYCRYPVDEFMKVVLYYKQLKVFIYFGVPGFADDSGRVDSAVMPFLGPRLRDEFTAWCDGYVERHGNLFATIYALSECGITHSQGEDAREYYRGLLKRFLSQIEYDVQQELCRYVFQDKGHLLIGSAYRNLYNDHMANDVRNFKHYWQQRGWDYACLTEKQRFDHQYVIGRTGFGKTYLLRNQIVQDIDAGHGVVLLTPERGLVDTVLSYVPDHRKKDVVVFDPSDSTSPVVGFNLFAPVDASDMTFRVGEITAILERSLGDFGVKMKPVIERSAFALLQTGGTLMDFARLLDPVDNRYRQSILDQVDPVTKEFFEKYDSSTYYKQVYEPVMNRINALRDDPFNKTFASASFDFDQVLNQQSSIFICDLSRLRGNFASLSAQLLLSTIQQAFFRRDLMNEEDCLPYFFYMDEFQEYASDNTKSMQQFLTRARKYQVGMVMAHQVMDNVPGELISTILGNAGTLVSMQAGSKEARVMAKEMLLPNYYDVNDPKGVDSYRALMRLDKGQCAVKLPGKGNAFYTKVPEFISGIAGGQDVGDLRAFAKSRYGVSVAAQPNQSKEDSRSDGDDLDDDFDRLPFDVS